MQKNSYSKAEVITAGRKLPERGLLCHECGATIPIFEDLSQADEKRVRESIQQSGPFMAIQELRTATGCSLEWAKLWVQHEGRPKARRDNSVSLLRNAAAHNPGEAMPLLLERLA